jgi:hypothetical protein
MFSLKQNPHYTALSYCWRTEDISESIQFQGSLQGTKMISRDLMSALWVHHSHFKNGWLWVDAICIDQSNTAEKNDQVPRMQMIYESADRVLVWLGEENPPAATKYDNSKYIGRRHKYNAALGLTRSKVMQLCDDCVEGRAWWCRVWVAQEMIVARQLYVCIGSHMLRWKTFVRATDSWAWLFYEREFELLEACRKVHELDKFRERWRTAKDSLDLLEILDIGRHSYATDARDSIYALLGLMTERDRKRIRVDYNCGADLLYAEMTAILIERQPNLDFLVKAFTYQHPQSQPRLPSWVLDFGDCLESYFPHGGGYLAKRKHDIDDRKKNQASADTRPSVRFHAQSLQLDVEAIIFDIVVATTIKNPLDKDVVEYRNTKRVGSSRSDEATKSSAFKKLVQLRCAEIDTGDDVEHPTEFDGPKQLERAWAQTKHFYLQFDVLQNVVIFTTASGFAGIAGYDMRSRMFLRADTKEAQSACPGDVIAIPLGSCKPWILRKTEVDGEYKLILDCIIPEIRSGEVMKLVEAKQMETQWLTLV